MTKMKRRELPKEIEIIEYEKDYGNGHRGHIREVDEVEVAQKLNQIIRYLKAK